MDLSMKIHRALIASALAAGSVSLFAGVPDTGSEEKQWSKSEFVNKAAERAAQRFEQSDANDDDVLSAEELRAYREEMREQRRTKIHKSARRHRSKELRDAF